MLKKIRIGLIIVFFFSCSKDPSVLVIKNLEGNDIKAIGHGGMGNSWKFPVNTRQSVHECLKNGTDGVEIDVQLTKDSVLVAFHGETMEDGTTCNGILYDNNWSDIENCRYKFFSPVRSNIARVDELLGSISGLKAYYFFFDCKHYTDQKYNYTYLNQYANAIIRLLEEYEISDRVFIESGNEEFFKLLQKKKKDLKLFIYPSDFDGGLKIALDMNLFGISFNTKYVSKEQSEMAHANGIRVALWSVDTEHKNMEAIEKNPDYIQTDKIRHLVKTLGKGE